LHTVRFWTALTSFQTSKVQVTFHFNEETRMAATKTAGKSPEPRAAPAGGKSGNAGSAKRPNMLVIWGDDIGISNLSCYSHGLMGYQTPNIDRIAREGMMFTDSYGEQSCTAGRSSFITGQSVLRTGLSKVGMPGAPIGMNEKIVTIAALLKEQGYATGQFGKNHLGDLNHMLPTNHGFDEFFGNLYHLNAEEDPESENYPKDPRFRERFGPRGVIHSWATDKDDATEQPRWGRVGKQKIEDTGPLTRKRMETIDDDFAAAATNFIKRQQAAAKPWFVWLNTSHMHFITHPKPKSKGQAGHWQSDYHDTMVDHDKLVGQMLALLDELGVAGDTFVMYSTDNGPHRNSWPDAGTTPFRSEKNTNWEGAFRIPLLVRWPGKIAPGSISNEIVQHHDWMPTFLEMAGAPGVVEELKKGYKAIGRTYRNHIDGYSLLAYLTGKEKQSPRKAFIYISDDGDILAVRYENWKVVFIEQRCRGTLQIWLEPFTRLRAPKIFNLRTDPFEMADITSNSYFDWYMRECGAFFIAGTSVAQAFADTFKDFPPIQKPNTFTIGDAITKMAEAHAGAT
jgi:arylsulfatase